MKFNNIFASLLLCATAATAAAQMPARTDSLMLKADPWLHLYYNSSTFTQMPMSDVLEFRFDEQSGKMIAHLSADDKDWEIPMSDIAKWSIGPNVPRFDINTDEWTYEIASKTDYVRGNLTFLGRGIYDDVTVDSMRIRGRGNSTWGMPKKPYRLKFYAKTKFGKVKKAKNLVLLANYMDKSLMRNYVAMQFAQLIGIQYPNHIMPCDVYLNGNYKGNYMLTEKVGINNGSVDIPALDEPNSIMFEMDTNDPSADEHRFYSGTCKIPVNFKDPDAPEDPAALQEWLTYWQNDFNEMEAAAAAGTDKAWDYIDLDAFVRYVMVFNFCTNQELKHPKSAFVWKTKGGKYQFGPVWDFDWAYGFDAGDNTVNYQVPLFTAEAQRYYQMSYKDNPCLGVGLFLPLVKNATFLARYAEIWNEFYANHRQEFFDAFDSYADIIRPTAAFDATILYPNTYYHSYLPTPEALRAWLEGHIEWINQASNNYGLWEEYNSWGGGGNWGGGGWGN